MNILTEFKNVLPESERMKKTQSNLQDRKWLETKVLPELSGSILFVGINYYTDFYHRLVKPGSTFITVDPDKSVAKYGSPNGHYIATVEELLNTKTNQYFDCCILYGLFGMKHSFIDIRTPEGKQSAINLIKLCLNATKKQIIFASSTDVATVDEISALYNCAKILDIRKFTLRENIIITPSFQHSNMFAIWEEIA